MTILWTILWTILYALTIGVLALAVLWIMAWNTGSKSFHWHRFHEDGRGYHYRVKLNHWLPRLTPWHEDAITLGDTIFALTDLTPDLHAHEFYHVTRNKQYGKVERFAYYLRDVVTHGYFGSSEEEAARAYSIAHRGEFNHLFTGEAEATLA